MKLAKQFGFVALALFIAWQAWVVVARSDASSSDRGPRSDLASAPDSDPPTDDDPDQADISDVLSMANDALANMQANLDDYTARFVKQERDPSGNLGDPTEIALRVQTRFRGPDRKSPRRAYLRFQSPAAVDGREVIWGEDLYDGKMAVHEVGMFLGLKTIWLNPTGMIAMQGQRFPISEIGLVKLVEKLIERGEQDRGNPDIRVSISEGHRFDDRDTRLIEVRRSKPNDQPDDFSKAEIVVDPEQQLILRYRSFGWPAGEEEEAPLLESYSYHDLKTNVGLSDIDFDTKNPEYNFPSF
ncbi:hypothetical protein K227x_60430 [Rubripirellula lacrimiformis]|uniref:DUF1571 domain-containing protein n=1 Tax=Rubripirellula lacrimiformis TaxID=1930273 RepID=A0A517NKE2_9BACT|nr:DUF1571 domain-containing protein [Rubripirellula lacrimiformis]QDT07615.1 hypothetical protein K227x_60430 [Rubripirellula lacrimiformis]